MIEWDRKDNINKRPMERTNNHLDELVKTVKSCGVSFNVWKKMDADGKDSGLHDFTSLMGSDKKHLLRALPSKLGGVIRPETSSDVVKLWKVYIILLLYIYIALSSKSGTISHCNCYQKFCRALVSFMNWLE